MGMLILLCTKGYEGLMEDIDRRIVGKRGDLNGDLNDEQKTNMNFIYLHWSSALWQVPMT